LNKILKDMDRWFLPRNEYFDVFAENDTRVESWFKAELLVLFSKLKEEGVMDVFEREPSIYDEKDKRWQIDFSVTIKGTKHYLELKALCISQSKGTPRNLSFYFRNNGIGVIKDFKKLDRIKIRNKGVVAFVYPKPDEKRWNNISSSINEVKY